MNKTKLCFVLGNGLMAEELKPENKDVKFVKVQLIQTVVLLALLLCFVLTVAELRIATAIALAIGLLIKFIVF